MPVPSSLVDVSTTASSNSPAGSEARSTSDDYHRNTQAMLKGSVAQGTDVASASTLALPAAGLNFDITGTTGITAIISTNSWDGREVTLQFDGACLLTHAASFDLGGANITTAAGSQYKFVQRSSGNWKMLRDFIQVGSGATTRTLLTKSRELISVMDYGAVGDGSTDDSTAVNLAATYLRSLAQSASGSVQTVCPAYLYFPPGKVYKLGASINLQLIQSYGWGVIGTGAIILATCIAKSVFDLLGSAFGTLRELTIIGSSTNKPAIGIQCGRIALNSNPAGGHHFDHIKMDGFFSVAGILNASGEGNLWSNLSIHNQDATGNAFALAIDGLHHIAPVTDFTASTTGTDVADSCIQHKVVNCDLSVASGAPIYASNCNQLDINGYAISKDAEIVRFQTGAALTTFRDIRLDFHVENAGSPGVTNTVIFSRLTSGVLAVEGLSLHDHNPHATDSLIKAGTNVTSLQLNKRGEIFYGGGYVGALTSGTVSIENSVRVNGLYQKMATNTFTLATDTATSFLVPGLLPSSNMEVNSDGGNVECALVWGRANVSPAMQSIVVGTSIALTTGVLSGTTGGAGKLTLSAHTDGKFYIENRTGGTRSIAVRLTGL